VAAGGTQAAGCAPRVCDPAPPPTTSPKPTPTPTYPRFCDPPPPPTMAPTPTRTHPPVICDPMPLPSATPSPTITRTKTVTPTWPVICDPAPLPPSSSPPGGGSSLDVPGTTAAAAQPDLPLAEIRSVEILWAGGLAFEAVTPWPAARYRWSVSGGLLEDLDDRVVWHPPLEPGLYLIQVAADWGIRGLAVDALALKVNDDGGVEFA